MLPLDTHAHIEPNIPPTELRRLGACVFAVTRSLNEYDQVAQRTDTSVAWGIGCHPCLVRSVQGFTQEAFRASLARSAVVGEVGLDGSSKVPMATQQEVLDQVFDALAETPRITSVHSYRATKPVLEILGRHKPRGVVLHWWLGDEGETTRAIELGAFFSVNTAQTLRWPALHLVPRDRLLTETDHPFGDRREKALRRPGSVQVVEDRLSVVLREQPVEIRGLAWRNLRSLVDDLGLHPLLPHQFQVQLLAT
jgi:TatD DNase family protein